MFRAREKLTDEESKEIADKLIEIVLDGYNKEIRNDFVKYSRSAQIGYDVTKCLVDKGVLKLGKYSIQRSMEE